MTEEVIQFPYTDDAGRVWIAYGATRDEYLNAIEGRPIYARREPSGERKADDY